MVSASVAVPLVVYGAVSVIQQINQTNEEAVLNLRAMHKHNTFMSQQELEGEHPSSQMVLASSSLSPSYGESQSSSDEPDTAAPAMLDQPERPEPRQPQSPATSSTDQDQKDRAHSQVPPQTAVLDRPDRPEPDSAGNASGDKTQSSIAAQQPGLQFSFAMSEAQSPVRVGSPETSQQASTAVMSS